MTLYKGTQKVCPIVSVGTTPNLQTKSVNLTNKNGQTFSADNGYDGLSSITVTPSNKTLSITPSKTSQTKTVPTNYSGYGTVTCSAVTSSIDSNITAGNIKNGVSILGVTGNYTGTTPTGTLSITANGTYDVTNYASANVSVSGGGGNVAIVQADSYSFTRSLAGEDLSYNNMALYIIVSSTNVVVGGFIGALTSGPNIDYSMYSFTSTALDGPDIYILLETYSDSQFVYQCMTDSGDLYTGKLNFTYTSPFS